MQHISRGFENHVSSTVTCPDCGRKFLTHTGIVERKGRYSISFQSKKTGRWGVSRLAEEDIAWGDTWGEAWAIKDREDGGA